MIKGKNQGSLSELEKIVVDGLERCAVLCPSWLPYQTIPGSCAELKVLLRRGPQEVESLVGDI